MEELARLEDERGNPAYLSDGKEVGGKRERIASNEMCTFLILNISSLQLLPVNMNDLWGGFSTQHICRLSFQNSVTLQYQS